MLFLKVHYWLFQLFFLQGTKNELYVDGSLFFFSGTLSFPDNKNHLILPKVKNVSYINKKSMSVL